MLIEPFQSLAELLPALGFLMLNVLIPGPNVLNTVGTSIGSDRLSGFYCALACGLGLFIWAVLALLGAAALFITFPGLTFGLTVIGALLLWYFSARYCSKALSKNDTALNSINTTKSLAFKRAFFIMITNPKVLTTWLAVISLFPIITQNTLNMTLFTFLSGFASFIGHAIYAFIFSSNTAKDVYQIIHKPINGIVGIGFFIYGAKLIYELFKQSISYLG